MRDGQASGIEIVDDELLIATTNFDQFQVTSTGYVFGFAIADRETGLITQQVDFSDLPNNRERSRHAKDITQDEAGRIWLTDPENDDIYMYDRLTQMAARFTSDLFNPVTPPLAEEINRIESIEYEANNNLLLLSYSGFNGNAQIYRLELNNFDSTAFQNCTNTTIFSNFCEIDSSIFNIQAVPFDIFPNGLSGIHLSGHNTLIVIATTPSPAIYEYDPNEDYTSFFGRQSFPTLFPEPAAVVTDPRRGGRSYIVYSNFFSTGEPEDQFQLETFITPGIDISDTSDGVYNSAVSLQVLTCLTFVCALLV